MADNVDLKETVVSMKPADEKSKPNDEKNSIELKFYSMLKEGEKVSKPLSVEKDTYFNSFLRTVTFTSSRNYILLDIKETVNESFEILDGHIKEYDNNKMKIEYRINDMYMLINSGLVNLKLTYKDDRYFESAAITLIENINSKIYSLCTLSPKLKQYIMDKKLFETVINQFEIKKDEVKNS